jgi:hypothetical protein
VWSEDGLGLGSLEVVTDDGLAGRRLLSTAIWGLPRERLGNAPIFSSWEVRNSARHESGSSVQQRDSFQGDHAAKPASINGALLADAWQLLET